MWISVGKKMLIDLLNHSLFNFSASSSTTHNTTTEISCVCLIKRTFFLNWYLNLLLGVLFHSVLCCSSDHFQEKNFTRAFEFCCVIFFLDVFRFILSLPLGFLVIFQFLFSAVHRKSVQCSFEVDSSWTKLNLCARIFARFLPYLILIENRQQLTSQPEPHVVVVVTV